MKKKTVLSKKKLNNENKIINLDNELNLKHKANVNNTFHCNMWEDNKDEVINDEDIEKIINSLEKYSINLPKEGEKLKTIETVKAYMPKNKKQKIKETFDAIINYLEFEISYINKYYFLLCFIVILIGIVVTRVFNYDYGLSLMVLSPLPLIFGTFEVFKGRECGAFELELTLKYSIKNVLVGRVMFISIFSILINFILSIVLWCINPSISLFRLSILWLTPLSIIGLLTLIVVSRIKGYVGSMISLVLWLVFSASLKVYMIQQFFLNLSLVYCFIIIALSGVLAIYAISNYLKKHIGDQCLYGGQY